MFLLFLFHSLCIFAQDRMDGIALEDYLVVDSSQFVVTYEMLQTRDVQKPSEKVYDYAFLEVGSKISRYHSKYLISFDSIYTAALKRGAQGIPPGNSDLYPFEIFKNHSEKTVQVFYRARMKGIFSYEEKLNEMIWVMVDEHETIAGFFCKKATCSYRGRKWTAWYTTEIPYSEGPWKFCGLPGLILKVEDSKDEYAFCCINIKRICKPIMVMQSYFYEKSSKAKVLELEKKSHDDFYGYMTIFYKSPNIVYDDGRQMTQEEVNKRFNKPYNPIELE
ncbi:MAG: GLPGLI family protein [Candidatus Limimorpha sp.]